MYLMNEIEVMASATLSVSGKNLSCAEVVEVMRVMGISGNVKTNTTVGAGGIENGCDILVTSDPAEHVKLLWWRLQKQFDLGCAHVTLDRRENGCVFDVFGKSRCPCSQNCGAP